MSRSKAPPYVHKLYAGGLILVVLFVLVAWGYTAYSLNAPFAPSDRDHQPSIAVSQCVQCHTYQWNAPPMPHVEFPSCGYCHRLDPRLPALPTTPSSR